MDMVESRYIHGLNHDTVEAGVSTVEGKFYIRISCAKRVVLQGRLSLPPRESLAHETTEHGEDGK